MKSFSNKILKHSVKRLISRAIFRSALQKIKKIPDGRGVLKVDSYKNFFLIFILNFFQHFFWYNNISSEFIGWLV